MPHQITITPSFCNGKWCIVFVLNPELKEMNTEYLYLAHTLGWFRAWSKIFDRLLEILEPHTHNMNIERIKNGTLTYFFSFFSGALLKYWLFFPPHSCGKCYAVFIALVEKINLYLSCVRLTFSLVGSNKVKEMDKWSCSNDWRLLVRNLKLNLPRLDVDEASP